MGPIWGPHKAALVKKGHDQGRGHALGRGYRLKLNLLARTPNASMLLPGANPAAIYSKG